MSFRRDGKSTKAWADWRAAHRDELIRSGVPDTVLVSPGRWDMFLMDRYDPETGFKPEMLNPQQAAALRQLVLQEYGEERYRHLLVGLAQRERPSATET